jgi:Flp pilus assembly protein TadG
MTMVVTAWRDRLRVRVEQRAERGAAAVFVLGMAIVLLVCAGLAIDGGLAINARMRAADDAEQAARIAADSIDVEQLRADGTLVIDQQLAGSRAATYLGRRGYGGGQYTVRVDAASVDVDVRDSTDTAFLGLVGIRRFDINATARAVPETEPQ